MNEHSKVKYYDPFERALMNEQFPPILDPKATYEFESSVKLGDNVRNQCAPCLRKRDNVIAADTYLRPPNKSAGRGLTNSDIDNKLYYPTPSRLIFPFSLSTIDMSYQRGYDTVMRNYHDSRYLVQDFPRGGYPTRLKDKYYPQP